MKSLALRLFPWLLSTLLAVGLSAVSGMSFLVSFVIATLAIFVNGWVAKLEDDLPGGFNNPDGSNTPAYVHRVVWMVRGLGLVLGIALLCALVFSVWMRP